MKLLIVSILFVVAAVVVGLAISNFRNAYGRGRLPEDGPWPYQSKPVLSDSEQVLYHRLCEALPECHILAQVALSGVIEPSTRDPKKAWFRKISQKSVDYVVCLKDFTTVAVIELDDGTHRREDRRKSDRDKDKALGDADLPIIRWTVTALPTVEQIRTTFTK